MKKSWVQKRVECTPEGLFQKLYLMVRANVKEMNGQSDAIRHHSDFSIHPEKELSSSSSYFCVYRHKGNDREKAEVRFCNDVEGRYITITPPLTDAFSVKHRWNQGRTACDLTVNGEEVSLWQVCKRALEPLFFQEN